MGWAWAISQLTPTYPLPSTLSHGWFPLGSSQLPPPSPTLAFQLCLALAQRGRRRHTDGHTDGQRATQGCLPTPAPCWHRAWARQLHTHTLTHTQMCILIQNYPSIKLSHIYTCRVDVRADTRCCTCCYVYMWGIFLRHTVSLPHTAALPVTHRCLRAYLQLLLNMCSPDISVHIHHDKHT